MLNAIYGAVAMWVLLGALFFWYDETANSSIYNFLDRVITLPWLIIYGAFVVMMFPLVCIWKFFRNAIKGVSLEAWNKYKTDKYLKMGNFYLCLDPKARALCNKLFLVRVVIPNDHITHDPELRTSNKPSTPPGEFNIKK
jgi:hypothetical protein